MKIIKLSAIDSTNSFLKEMVLQGKVHDFTVIVAEAQTSGRGQMNTKWVTESGKNLICSVFVCLNDVLLSNQKYLSYVVSNSIHQVLITHNLPKLNIKWPNDILSDKKKICGILIENTLKGHKIAHSIIGVGLNVNQESFPTNLPNATSMKMLLEKEFDLDVLLKEILVQLKGNLLLLNQKKFEALEAYYLDVLYKKNVPSMFKTTQNVLFMGKIIGVSKVGNLLVELENETVQEFGLKEVSFA